jgi:hypothetical protein
MLKSVWDFLLPQIKATIQERIMIHDHRGFVKPILFFLENTGTPR